MKYITAKKLAEMLLENPDDIVCITTDNFEQGHNTIPFKRTSLNRFKGDIQKKGFRDAFDGESYSVDVVEYNDNGKLNFVKI